MDSTPLLIGSIILNIILCIVLLILHFPQVIHTIRSFLVNLFTWLRNRPMAFNRWRWWRKYRPYWEIVNHGDMKIKFDGTNYHIGLQVDIKFTNGQDRYEADYDSYVWLIVYHKGKGWEKQPYHLFNEVPLGHRKLEPSDSEQVTYGFEIKVPSKPLLGNTVICKIADEIYGGIWTPHVSLWGKLKRKGTNKFKVNVKWEPRQEIPQVTA